MQLTPRYDAEPLVTVTGQVGDPAMPLLRQRRRFGAVLRHLDDDQWAAPSRCEAWTVHGVVSHLVDTTGFWALAMQAGLDGAPTRILATFDPVATPLLLTAARTDRSPGALLEEYDASVDALAQVVTDLEPARWSEVAEAPPGHVSLEAVALHALWDSWVHERDCLLPLGLAQEEQPDEILGSLRYAAALGPAFGRTRGDRREGRLGVTVTDPDASFVVEVGATVTVVDGALPEGAPTLRGPAVEVLEALSFRAPARFDLPPEDRWLVSGLDAVFDRS